MENVIQIKCPFCGAILSVKHQAGIESKNVTCPICKHKYPFNQLKKANNYSSNAGGDTEYPYKYNNGHYKNEEQSFTEMPKMNFIIGRLMVVSTGEIFQLKMGRNVIGRKTPSSTADFKINTGDDLIMSREHLAIEVKNVAGKGVVHYASLFKERVNETRIGNDRLFYGDTVVLRHGEKIQLPGLLLKFEIPDDEATQLNI